MPAKSLYHQSLDHLFAAGERAVSPSDFAAALARLEPVMQKLQRGLCPFTAAILRSCEEEGDLAALEARAKSWQGAIRHLVVIGSGGSGLSAKALAALTAPFAPSGIALHVLDHIDPGAVERLIHSVELARTGVLIISKSGGTVETLAVAAALFDAAEKKGVSLAKHTLGISVPGENALRQLARIKGFEMLDHDPDLCGRFSILSSVGLLPAAVLGLDIRAMRRGARQVLRALREAAAAEALEAAKGAAMQSLMMQRGCAISVMMVYGESLSGLAWWYRQSWAESLGKQGKPATPYASFGTTDQHSQLQLYLEGARDKFFTFIMPQSSGQGPGIALPEPMQKTLSYLSGRTLGDVMEAEARATYESLVRHGCPVRLIGVPRVGEESLGALLAHFMLEIIFTAALLEVNAFDQPAVEESKQLARDYLAEMAR